MYRLLCIAVLISPAWSSYGGHAAAANTGYEGQQKKEPSKRAKTSAASMTGCVDEQDGRYVLVDDRTLKPIADLAAEGFPTEGFAKHLGHKVTVSGTADVSAGDRPLFKVRGIKTISDVCAPDTQHQ